jgi:hypothetical protein
MMPTTTASRMRLDSRARTSARSRRGISKGFPTLATNAITAHHAAVAIVGSGRGSASLSSQHVVFFIDAADAPPGLRRRRAHARRTPHPSGSQRIQRPGASRERRSRRVTNSGSGAFAENSGTRRAGDQPSSSDEAPADITENDQTDDNQRGADDAAQRVARHDMGQLGAEPGADA